MQRASTATSLSSTDVMRPPETRDLLERLTSTSVQLVHTEVVTRPAAVSRRIRSGTQSCQKATNLTARLSAAAGTARLWPHADPRPGQ